ncbi:hypothetical protein AL036_10990 [Salipiger aestuarii]|uniref:Arginine transporter n=1 Tax=Salipiger aestuarii TaxID=568098 RepID=A0A327YBS8_9RHOB|nr:hypothetical protein [Salipiger aestuarii]EIE50912.1 hypothetical protein C357_11304 [Citreicella sp. 357]KAA8607408.1 hypothetical protein AL036_10990 [Salipiger aestuarii]KAA8612106.1 hypothetical protein AL037_08400 [Salipiger aestuarii]KAB2541739.1 hypothetical protein AL035_10595 [Salipiger aestuarii]RAK17265.1 hypothetical protein ATI53_101563 [Salipiger aestuarii]
MKAMCCVLALTVVAGCAGGARDVGAARFASGPISNACNGSERRASNPGLCGCIQAAADIELSGRDQRRAVRFYNDPHSAQVVRQSDRPSDEAFWKRYSAYVDRSERLCKGL